MARALTPTLDLLQTAETRTPGFAIEIFDVRSTEGFVTPEHINDVVLTNLGLSSISVIVGPRVFTNDIEFVDMVEVAGDYTTNGVAATQVTFTVQDPTGLFDPVDNPAPADGRWLRQGNVIVIREGDASVVETDWPITFTGTLVGQPGQNRNRTTGLSVLTCKALSREQDFLRQNNTSQNFAQNAAYLSMITTLAGTDMGLALGEQNLPTFTVRLTPFTSTQFVDESPLVSIAKIMFADGFMPRFEGDGRLGTIDSSITKGPVRIYGTSELQTSVLRPFLAESGVNEVIVIGLDSTMSRIDQIRQTLATASITTGFFSDESVIDVVWSDDQTQQALNLVLEVDSSVADGLFNFGSESFSNGPTAADGGSTGGTITVAGGLIQNLSLLTLIVGSWGAAHTIPDLSLPSGGPTTPIGRLVEGAVGQTIMTILASQGRGQYRVTGEPYEYVFPEIRATARKLGVRSQDVKSLTVNNHLINTQADADLIAERVYRRERAKQNRRTIAMIHDLKVEPDDIIELGVGLASRRYVVQSIKRRLVRGGGHLATLECFEVTAGVLP